MPPTRRDRATISSSTRGLVLASALLALTGCAAPGERDEPASRDGSHDARVAVTSAPLHPMGSDEVIVRSSSIPRAVLKARLGLANGAPAQVAGDDR